MKQRIDTSNTGSNETFKRCSKETNCPHGFDIACLICGFGEKNRETCLAQLDDKETGMWHDKLFITSAN